MTHSRSRPLSEHDASAANHFTIQRLGAAPRKTRGASVASRFEQAQSVPQTRYGTGAGGMVRAAEFTQAVLLNIVEVQLFSCIAGPDNLLARSTKPDAGSAWFVRIEVQEHWRTSLRGLSSDPDNSGPEI
jgi:hypothetical protein